MIIQSGEGSLTHFSFSTNNNNCFHESTSFYYNL